MMGTWDSLVCELNGQITELAIQLTQCSRSISWPTPVAPPTEQTLSAYRVLQSGFKGGREWCQLVGHSSKDGFSRGRFQSCSSRPPQVCGEPPLKVNRTLV